VHPDAPCALRMLWSTLPPEEVAVAIYPQLSSWAGPEEVAFPRHSLSQVWLGGLGGEGPGACFYRVDSHNFGCRVHSSLTHILTAHTLTHAQIPPHVCAPTLQAAMALSDQPIFLLDTYSSLIVLYAMREGSGSPPFPPPQRSLLRQHINAVRQVRQRTPMLRMLREGVDDTHEFMRWLIEDAAAEEEGGGEGGASAAAEREERGGGGDDEEMLRLPFVHFLEAVEALAVQMLEEK
jgi:hypothetical protein